METWVPRHLEPGFFSVPVFPGGFPLRVLVQRVAWALASPAGLVGGGDSTLAHPIVAFDPIPSPVAKLGVLGSAFVVASWSPDRRRRSDRFPLSCHF